MQNISVKHYSNPAHDAYLDGQLQNISIEMKNLGKHTAKENMLHSMGDFNAIALNKIQAVIQQLIHQNKKTIRPIALQVQAAAIRKTADEKMQAIEAEKNEAETKLEQLALQFQSMHEPAISKPVRYSILIALIFFALGDALWSIDAIRNAGLNTVMAVIICICIFFCLITLPFMAEYVMKAKTQPIRVTRGIVISLMWLAVFAYLGYNRHISQLADATYTELIAHQNVSVASPLLFSIISFLFYLVSFVLCLKLWQSPEEKQADKQYAKTKREIQSLGVSVKEYQSHIDEIQATAEQEIALMNQVFEYAYATESRLITAANLVEEVFKESHIKFRKDGTIPGFFAIPHQFHFERFFSPLKTYMYEKVD